MDRGAVLVTGCSSGIGRACAEHLASLGFHVLAGVRREADGDAVRGERVEPVILDVAAPDATETARAAAERGSAARGLAGLVNNAGVTVQGPVEFVTLDEWRRQLEVNLLGQIAMIQATLPLLRAARGRIVNMSSIGGRLATPFLGPYNASKFALEGMSDALREEVRPHGVGVALVEPGSVATPIWEKGQAAGREQMDAASPEQRRLYGERLEAMVRLAGKTAERGVPPSAVAEAVAHALTARRPRPRYVVGRDAKLQLSLRAAIGARGYDRLAGRIIDSS